MLNPQIAVYHNGKRISIGNFVLDPDRGLIFRTRWFNGIDPNKIRIEIKASGDLCILENPRRTSQRVFEYRGEGSRCLRCSATGSSGVKGPRNFSFTIRRLHDFKNESREAFNDLQQDLFFGLPASQSSELFAPRGAA